MSGADTKGTGIGTDLGFLLFFFYNRAWGPGPAVLFLGRDQSLSHEGAGTWTGMAHDVIFSIRARDGDLSLPR